MKIQRLQPNFTILEPKEQFETIDYDVLEILCF